MEVALNALTSALAGVVADRRRAPREDLVSALIAAEEQGQHLTEAELLATLRLLLIAGNETTTNLIGNGTLALLRHSEELAKLRAHPSLLPRAIEEMLRFDPPVQAVRRIAMRDFEAQGRRIRLATPRCLLEREPVIPCSHGTLDFRISARRPSDRVRAGIHYCPARRSPA
jgi:cytochrome P450